MPVSASTQPVNSKPLKAVIPVAGLGTRMLPATKVIPKEMLPLVDKPLIQLIVEECHRAGLHELVFVTHSSKNSIENHFDTSFELEATLEKRVKRQLLSEVQQIMPHGMTIMHVRQSHAKGLGHAVLCAAPLIGDAPFAVILPDVIVQEGRQNRPGSFSNLSAMLARFTANNRAQVLVEAVSRDQVSSFGIVSTAPAAHTLVPADSALLTAIIEKPEYHKAPSQLGVMGRYLFPKTFWPLLQATLPDSHGEIQLTDAIAALLQREPVDVYVSTGTSYDCGDKLGYMKAFIAHGLEHPVLGELFKDYIKQCVQPSATGRGE